MCWQCSPPIQDGGPDIPAGIMGYGTDSKKKFMKVSRAWKQILAKTSCGQVDYAHPSGHLESGLADGVCTHELRSVKFNSILRQSSAMRHDDKIGLPEVPHAKVTERKMLTCRAPEKFIACDESVKPISDLAKENTWKIVSDSRPAAANSILPSPLHKQGLGAPGNKLDPKDLVLEKCVGKGAFGTVYKANLRGETVAVKVISHSPSQPSIQVAPELELLHGICHPNIVHVQGVFPGMEGYLDDQESVSFDTRTSLTSGVLSDFARELSDKKGGSNYSSETWVIMGYCDQVRLSPAKWTSTIACSYPPFLVICNFCLPIHITDLNYCLYCLQGSLWDAVRRGDLGIKGSSKDPHYSRVVEVALEVAFAMQHLHEVGIIHGDLKAQNVMLQGSKSSHKNFIAKVGDFGLCRRSPDRYKTTLL